MASADTILVEDAKETTRYASRKWLLALLVILVGVAMSWFDKLAPQLVDLLKWTAGLYFGFNVSQKAAEWVATKLAGRDS